MKCEIAALRLFYHVRQESTTPAAPCPGTLSSAGNRMKCITSRGGN
ncbi:hypothetical protein HMPREF1545_03882 [Oscillibacter sp. KLE 1728]|nr:hypothetical protein HMPREF1545_03882 [Oscillibacter sp. KLE 1728]